MAVRVYPAADHLAGLSRRALVIGLLGIAATAAGAVLAREQFFRSYLTAFVFWAGLGIGSLGILLLSCVVGGNWGVAIRRPLESAARTMPLLALFFVPVLFGLGDLYLWARPEAVAGDAVLTHKAPYLNVPFLVARMAFFFGTWSLVAFAVSKMSLAQDQGADRKVAQKLRRICGPLIILHVMMVTFSSFDWTMSLEPHWFSTVYGILALAGQNLGTIALMIAVIVWLGAERVTGDGPTKQAVYDLGNLMLAFTMFWAYIAFSQILIIWAGNLPEEIPWYLKRLQGGWQYVGLLVVLFHFAVPFLMLINRYVKRSPKTLSRVALLVIVMRLVETFFTIGPAHETAVPFHFHWLDLAAPIGLGGLWLAFFLNQLKGRVDVPSHNLLSEEAVEHGRA